MPSTSVHTMIVVAIFALWYLTHTIRKTARQELDLYDLTMLSAVAIIPAGFTFFPNLAYSMATAAGVAFPFVVMFGVLFAVLFVFIHRLTAKVHCLERDNRLLIQEVSLLKQLSDQPGTTRVVTK